MLLLLVVTVSVTVLLLSYAVYHAVILPYRKWQFFTKQGIPFAPFRRVSHAIGPHQALRLLASGHCACLHALYHYHH